MGKYGAGQCIRVAVVWQNSAAQEFVNTHHISLGGTIDSDDNVVEGAIALWLEEAYADAVPYMSSILSHNRTEILIENSTAATSLLSPDSNLDGADTNQPLPFAVSYLILLRTAVRGVVGRKYLPVFTEASSTNGVWTAGTNTDMASVAAAFSSVWTSPGGMVITPRVYSRASNTQRAITGYAAQAVPAYQRRRRPGRGS